MKRPQIGKNIKSYRIRAKMTQQKLALILATTQGHIGQIERGGRYPSIDMLFAIAEALNCTAADLVSDSGISSDASVSAECQTRDSIDRKLSGLAYWGDMVDRARETARRSNTQDLIEVREMLKKALTSVDDACLALGVGKQASLPATAGAASA